ncbi:hypothetical protein SmJEL517_g05822 [Synchytrium microbalum]|uniref:Major facilitator superfamily (MFS) profile domain-containing protein n=1 Tax=Synchytrium microbalum TaxID=1806994 RepID=A0A507BTK9_9FUNG|nr:uncharacterized protein SmJEL517_g05822 [Synchytrium microbalum]TPX30668.1 hypothetical protein SmJEL517_g05822 [Synchytrium microbalum]
MESHDQPLPPPSVAPIAVSSHIHDISRPSGSIDLSLPELKNIHDQTFTRPSLTLEAPPPPVKPAMLHHKTFGFLPTPIAAQYDPATFVLKPIHSVIFALSALVMVANLYYSQPILNDIAAEFGISEAEVGLIPSLSNYGYACGLLLLVPTGDILPRRELLLALGSVTFLLTVGVILAPNLAALQALNFVIGVLTCAPQILIPLTADLAPDDKKAAYVGWTISGLMAGILCGRIMSGIVAQFISWRYVYLVAACLNGTLLVVQFFLLPAVPAPPNPPNYIQMLWSMVKLYREPILVQSGIIAMMTFAGFTIFWTTLTYLLHDTYLYPPYAIGMFGFCGLAGILVAPLTGKFVDKWGSYLSVFIGLVMIIVAYALLMGTAELSVVGVVFGAFFLDVGVGFRQIGNQTRVFAINKLARSRLNACYMLMSFFGGSWGSVVGSTVYQYHGWKGSSLLCIVMTLVAMVVHLARFPNVTGWVGMYGGWFSKPVIPTEEVVVIKDR